MPKKPLEGIRVIDFSWVAVGPLTTKYLADFGAEVIRIESGLRLDVLRNAGPYVGGEGGIDRAGHWLPINTSKKDITLNLATPEGIKMAKELVKISDVVVENFTTRVMKGWGLDYANLQEIKPDIVMLSISMEGRTGPHSDYLGFGTVLQSAAGITHLQGWPDRTPVPPGNAYTDWVVPHTAVVALMSALDYRRRTGEGQYIDLSCIEAGVHCLETAILDYTVNRRVQDRVGNNLVSSGTPYAVPHGAYRCKGDDRWCVIAVFTDQDWLNLCHAVGQPEWTKDHRFATLLARVENMETVDRLLEAWTLLYTPEEVMHRLQDVGVTAGVVQSSEDIRKDPQLRHRGQVAWLDHPDEEHPIPYDMPPFRYSTIPTELRRAPSLGENNLEIFKDLLNLSDQEFEGLAANGVFE